MPKPAGNPLRALATGAINNWMDMFPEWGKVPLMRGQQITKEATAALERPGPMGGSVPLVNSMVNEFDYPPYTSKYPDWARIAAPGVDPLNPPPNPFGDPPSIMFEGGNAGLRKSGPPPVEGLPEELLPPTEAISGEAPDLFPEAAGTGPMHGPFKAGLEDAGSDIVAGYKSAPKEKTKSKIPFGSKKGLAGVAGITGLALGAGMLGANSQMAGEESSPEMEGEYPSPKNSTNSRQGKSKKYSAFPFDVDMGKVGEVNNSQALARFLRESAQTTAGQSFKEIGRTPGNNSPQEKKNYQAFLNQSMKLVEDLAKKHNIQYNPQEVYQMAFTKWQDNNKQKKK